MAQSHAVVTMLTDQSDGECQILDWTVESEQLILWI